ncbi:hypothetical protein AB833_21005 [Chromatiales bacterium (ex Bugula neritina AB1)]|nr:hypothetical protein AB833_21005 [Chromatiales bacterium (ex Bugula neritina AB1)]
MENLTSADFVAPQGGEICDAAVMTSGLPELNLSAGSNHVAILNFDDRRQSVTHDLRPTLFF